MSRVYVLTFKNSPSLVLGSRKIGVLFPVLRSRCMYVSMNKCAKSLRITGRPSLIDNSRVVQDL